MVEVGMENNIYFREEGKCWGMFYEWLFSNIIFYDVM